MFHLLHVIILLLLILLCHRLLALFSLTWPCLSFGWQYYSIRQRYLHHLYHLGMTEERRSFLALFLPCFSTCTSFSDEKLILENFFFWQKSLGAFSSCSLLLLFLQFPCLSGSLSYVWYDSSIFLLTPNSSVPCPCHWRCLEMKEQEEDEQKFSLLKVISWNHVLRRRLLGLKLAICF